MTRLPVLLKKLEALHRQQIELEYQIASIKRAIVAACKGNRPRRKRATPAKTVEGVRETVKVLQDAGEPLPRREIAARLGIALHAVDYRLRKAVAARFVEKVSGGRYRVSADVPVL